MTGRPAAATVALLLLALAFLPACGDDGGPSPTTTTTPSSSSTTASSVTSSTSTSTSSSTSAPPVAPTVEPAVVERGTDTSATEVSIRYPQLRGMSDPAAEQRANRALQALVQAEADRFEAAAEDIAGSGGPGAEGDQLSAQGDYEQVRVDARVAGFRITVSEYLGGAHPTEQVLTANVDVATGRVLALGDLFRAGTDWPGVLSSASRRLLKERLGGGYSEDEVARGTTPDPANFAAFVVAPGALEVTFQNYQVGAYALGTPTISIPGADLAPVLAEGTPLS